MIALTLYLVSLASLRSAPLPCEELPARLDGTRVTVCAGHVVRVRDQLGTSREVDPRTGTITVTSPGARPWLLPR
jgi:hypothetical protein